MMHFGRQIFGLQKFSVFQSYNKSFPLLTCRDSSTTLLLVYQLHNVFSMANSCISHNMSWWEPLADNYRTSHFDLHSWILWKEPITIWTKLASWFFLVLLWLLSNWTALTDACTYIQKFAKASKKLALN